MAASNDYIEVSIETGGNQHIKDILIARLSAAGFEGFEEQRELLKAYIPQAEFNEPLLQSMLAEDQISYTSALIQSRNWNEAWEAGFAPVVVDAFCAIRADFHQPVEGVRYDIIITPKMSFGTGHHATTYLMIEAMQYVTMKGKSVFDFGTGTGVLAILAARMGAEKVEAIDIDEWSIENGQENLLRNKTELIRLYQAASIGSAGKFDLILANINRNIILDHMQSMQQHLAQGGVLLLSGLLEGDEMVVHVKATEAGLLLTRKTERNSWICLEYVNS